jgi:hypothetical protein
MSLKKKNAREEEIKTFDIFIVIILLSSTGVCGISVEEYGFKSGVSITTQDFIYTSGFNLDLRYRRGLNVGIYFELLDVEPFSLLSEVHYIQKGMIDDVEIEVRDENGRKMVTFSFNNRVDYLSIPILAKITSKTNYLSPYLSIGPRFDFLLGYKAEDADPIYESLKKIDIGGDIAIGTGIGLFSGENLLIEFRYSPDFTDAYKTDLLRVRNQAFEILFGAGFKI